MSFGGPPITVESEEEANEILRNIEMESAIGKKFKKQMVEMLEVLKI